jgi:hypothetical protein
MQNAKCRELSIQHSAFSIQHCAFRITFQVALADVVIPWSSRRTHPSFRERVIHLWRAATPAEALAIERLVRAAGYDHTRFLREPTPERQAGAAAGALALCALLLLAMLVYGTFARLDAPPHLPTRAPAATPTAGPTPTLGF